MQTNKSDYVIETDQVCRSFKKTVALENFNLRVPRGSIYGFLGRNGSGKTTAIKILAGLIKPTSGSARVMGRIPFEFTPEDRQKIGYVSEKQILPTNFAVGTLITFCAQFYPLWDHNLVRRLLERFRINPRQAIGKLSQGTQRQVAFILALAQRPELLILDEPAATLDVVARREFLVAFLMLLQAGMALTNEWAISDHSTTNLSAFPFLFCVLIAGAFFGIRTGYAGGQMPHKEFLLSRPILRRTAYFSRSAPYFIMMLAVPLVEVYVTTTKTDLRIDFSVGTDQTILTRQIEFYQDQFPDSSVVHNNPRFQRGGYVETLMIHSGASLIARWDLFVAIAFSLAIQLIIFFVPASKDLSGCLIGVLMAIYLLIFVVIILIFPQLGPEPTLYERAFFFFARHQVLTALYLLGFFVLVQWIALKRIQKLEVT